MTIGLYYGLKDYRNMQWSVMQSYLWSQKKFQWFSTRTRTNFMRWNLVVWKERQWRPVLGGNSWFMQKQRLLVLTSFLTFKIPILYLYIFNWYVILHIYIYGPVQILITFPLLCYCHCNKCTLHILYFSLERPSQSRLRYITYIFYKYVLANLDHWGM